MGHGAVRAADWMVVGSAALAGVTVALAVFLRWHAAARARDARDRALAQIDAGGNGRFVGCCRASSKLSAMPGSPSYTTYAGASKRAVRP